MKLLVLVLCAALLAPASAGDWRGARNNALYNELPESERTFNDHEVPLLAMEDMPKNFNWCGPDVNMCTSSWNQHQPYYCGSCFLHGTLSMIQDRLKIAKGGVGPDVVFGRQSFLNCAPFHGMSDGCGGGEVIDVFRYMRHHGLPDESCLSYNATDYSKYRAEGKFKEGEPREGTCPDEAFCTNCMPSNVTDPETGKAELMCWPVKTPITYRLASYGKMKSCGVQAMMSEILQRGPITCGMAGPNKEFGYEYSGGIYQGPNDETVSDNDHDVEVVGWGESEEDGKPYWVVRNSWGTYWGEKGFFKLLRGVNKLNIEACDCHRAIPEFSMEADYDAGLYGGSMFGIRERAKESVARSAEADTLGLVHKAMANLHGAGAARRSLRHAE